MGMTEKCKVLAWIGAGLACLALGYVAERLRFLVAKWLGWI